MEQILVGMDSEHIAWEALTRACTLAERIDARLHVLLVRRPTGGDAPVDEARREEELRQNLELRIEEAKARGIHIDYYVADGSFEEEIVRFVNGYRITLLVLELRDRDARSAEKGAQSLQAIRHRIACKVETVVPRKQTIQPQERNS